MLNEVLRQNPDLRKFKREKEQIEKDYLNFKIASFKATELMISESGIEFTKNRILEQFIIGSYQIDRLSKDKDFIDFLKEKNIDIS